MECRSIMQTSTNKQFNIRAPNCLRWCRFFSKHRFAFSKYVFQQHWLQLCLACSFAQLILDLTIFKVFSKLNDSAICSCPNWTPGIRLLEDQQQMLCIWWQWVLDYFSGQHCTTLTDTILPGFYQEIGNLVLHSLDAIQLLPGVRQAQTNKSHFPYEFHRTQNDARVFRGRAGGSVTYE